MEDAELSSSVQLRKPVGRPFLKGKSPNPGGISKRIRAVRKALEKDADLARQVLREAMENGNTLERIAAAKVVLKYTVPEPKATLDVTVSAKPMPAVDPEVAAKIAALDA